MGAATNKRGSRDHVVTIMVFQCAGRFTVNYVLPDAPEKVKTPPPRAAAQLKGQG